MLGHLPPRFRCLLGLATFLIATPALAGESGWTIAQQSGHVTVFRPGLQPASLAVNAHLNAGDLVVTSADGRAMLTNGDDYVVVSPGSRLSIPQEPKVNGITKLYQMFGTMLYKVKPTGHPHFEVKAPMLAAVVKGTTFSIVVDGHRNAVQVVEGVVEVSSLDHRSVELVQRGRTVLVDSDRPGKVDEVTELKKDSSSDKDAVHVRKDDTPARTDVSSLTGGLVKEVAFAAGAANDEGEQATSNGARVTGVVASLATRDESSAVSAAHKVGGGAGSAAAVVTTVVAVVNGAGDSIVHAAPGSPAIAPAPNVAPAPVATAPVVTPVITSPVVNPVTSAPIVSPVLTPVVAPIVNAAIAPVVQAAPLIPIVPHLPNPL